MLKARHIAILLGAFLVTLGISTGGAWASPLAEKVDPKLRALVEKPGNIEIKQTIGTLSRENETWVEVLVQGDVDEPLLRAHGAEARTVLPGVATATLPISKVEALAGTDRVRRVSLARELKPLLDGNIPETQVTQVWGGSPPSFPQSGFTGKDVIVGIIDTGIDIDHPDFQLSNGQTRILNIWDHTTASNPNPSGYTYGSEWSASEINSGACSQKDSNGHGTYIAGAAAGDGSGTGNGQPAYQYVGMAPEADIIAVKLGFALDTYLIDAVNYIKGKAAQLNKDAVICIAVGKQSGPHDGTDPLDVAMDGLAGDDLIIVAAAGNEGLSDIHGELSLGRNATGVVSIDVPSHILLSDEFIDIEGWFDQSDDFTVKIISPGGQTFGPFGRGTTFFEGAGEAGVLVLFSDPASGPVDVFINLTRTGSTPIAPGEWKLEVKAIGDPNGSIDFWVSDQKLAGGTPASVLQGQTPAKCVASPASASQVIGVGAYTVRNTWTNQNGQPMVFSDAIVGAVANFSSIGPRRDGAIKPDIVASGYGVISTKSDDAWVFSSFIAADGMHYMASGTSVSAAITAGAVALLLEESNQALNPSEIKALLNQRAMVDGSTGGVPNPIYGHGKLSMVESSTTGVGDFVDGFLRPGLSLGAAFPNPLQSGRTQVTLALEQDSEVRVAVFDVQGKEVRVLRSGFLPAGEHAVSWDGLDHTSREVPAGRYFLRASDGVQETSTSILVVQ